MSSKTAFIPAPENCKAAATARALLLLPALPRLCTLLQHNSLHRCLKDGAASLTTMSQTTFDLPIEDIARLEREAESKEYELRQIRAQVAAARQRSIATSAHNPDLLPTSQSNFQFSSLPTSAPQDARLRATNRHGDLTVHTGPQPSVRAVPPACPIRPVPNMTSRSNINTTRHIP